MEVVGSEHASQRGHDPGTNRTREFQSTITGHFHLIYGDMARFCEKTENSLTQFCVHLSDLNSESLPQQFVTRNHISSKLPDTVDVNQVTVAHLDVPLGMLQDDVPSH